MWGKNVDHSEATGMDRAVNNLRPKTVSSQNDYATQKSSGERGHRPRRAWHVNRAGVSTPVSLTSSKFDVYKVLHFAVLFSLKWKLDYGIYTSKYVPYKIGMSILHDKCDPKGLLKLLYLNHE